MTEIKITENVLFGHKDLADEAAKQELIQKKKDEMMNWVSIESRETLGMITLGKLDIDGLLVEVTLTIKKP